MYSIETQFQIKNMKIAFVAKGGSGKSTTTALFLKYIEARKKSYLCVDADINMHMMDLLGVSLEREKGISLKENQSDIKKFIRGNNERVHSADQIVKTTPPSFDSNFLYIKEKHPLIQKYAVPVQKNGYLMHVGTYEKEGIGESCYHTNLSIFEALVSHTITDDNHLLVADMTAGTDAFAGALHAQFDLVCLVVEPTKESVALARDYIELAKEGQVMRFMAIIANKVEDDEDVKYIENQLGLSALVSIPMMKELKLSRREGKSIFDIEYSYPDERVLFDALFERAKENMLYADQRLSLLHTLHKKHVQADYIIGRHGDLSGQIDPTFSYHQMKYEY